MGTSSPDSEDALEQAALDLFKKNANLRRTRDLLLPKLLSGEIDVSSLNIRLPTAAETV